MSMLSLRSGRWNRRAGWHWRKPIACSSSSYSTSSSSNAAASIACIQEWRLAQWEEEAQRQRVQRLAQQQHATSQSPIEITWLQANNTNTNGTSDGVVVHGTSHSMTPMDVLKELRERGLPRVEALVARVNSSQIVDLCTPLATSCQLEFLDFSHDAGKQVFWHSSAHVLGQALEEKYTEKIRLCDGPSLSEGGFFYEMFLHDELTISDSAFQELTTRIKQIVKQKQPFERMQVTREFAAKLFKYSDFKLDLLQRIPADEPVSLYRCGPFVDLCRGPHVPHTGVLRAFEVTRCGASHWDKGDFLQRVYGISFPSNSLLKEWKHLQEEAKKRDHRVIGKAQQLFLFHALSPGSCFFLPHGTRIFNKLANFIRAEYKKRGYDEVITPLIFKKELWKTSGHLKNYSDDMFMVSQGIQNGDNLDKDDNDSTTSPGTRIHHDHNDGACDHPHDSRNAPAEQVDQFGLKPMNCPGHCLLFKESKKYSYRDLPIRFADFSALHRNEASGALTGLTRVRRFHQDDAHIFCTTDQVQHEIQECLNFIKHVYGVFGFEFQLRLSTRPDKYMGELSLWDTAEDQLRLALDGIGLPWEINPGDGAFYGPKIDIVVTDALQRHHQLGTIQLDFQLPLNFELTYDGNDGQEHRPVMIHRAVLGSIERMMAILIEHTGGKWPLWLSPRQVAVVPISEAQRDYANQVAKRLVDQDLFVDILDTNKTLNKRIREAQVIGYNYILVLGAQEVDNNLVNVRTRDNKVHGPKSLDAFAHELQTAIDNLE